MNAFQHRALLAVSLVSLASILAGCNGGTASPAIPASSSHFGKSNDHTGGMKIWVAAEQTSKLFALSSDAKVVLKVISTEDQPVKGSNPVTLKVDGKDLYVTDLRGGKAGIIQEYEGRALCSRLLAWLSGFRLFDVYGFAQRHRRGQKPRFRNHETNPVPARKQDHQRLRVRVLA